MDVGYFVAVAVKLLTQLQVDLLKVLPQPSRVFLASKVKHLVVRRDHLISPGKLTNALIIANCGASGIRFPQSGMNAPPYARYGADRAVAVR
jgi:hypothetical protein